LELHKLQTLTVEIITLSVDITTWGSKSGDVKERMYAILGNDKQWDIQKRMTIQSATYKIYL